MTPSLSSHFLSRSAPWDVSDRKHEASTSGAVAEPSQTLQPSQPEVQRPRQAEAQAPKQTQKDASHGAASVPKESFTEEEEAAARRLTALLPEQYQALQQLLLFYDGDAQSTVRCLHD